MTQSKSTTLPGADCCPFCQSTRQLLEWRNAALTEVWVRCEYCGAAGPIDKHESHAIRRWNEPVREQKEQEVTVA